MIQLGSASLVKVIGDSILKVLISIRYLENQEIPDIGKICHGLKNTISV